MSPCPATFPMVPSAPDHAPALAQVFAVGRPQHCTAAGRYHLGRRLGQAVDDFFFDVAEARFALTLKKLTHGATCPDFDFVV